MWLFGVGMVLLEEVCHCGSGIWGFLCSGYYPVCQLTSCCLQDVEWSALSPVPRLPARHPSPWLNLWNYKQASKQLPPWPLHPLLPPGSSPVWVPALSSLSDEQQCWLVSHINSFRPNLLFGHGVLPEILRQYSIRDVTNIEACGKITRSGRGVWTCH